MSAALAEEPEDLYRSLKPSFVNIVASKLGISRQEADDLYNPAFSKVWEKAATGEADIDDPLNYLVTAGVNEFRMEHRKHGARAVADGESALQSVDTISDLVEDADLRQQISLFAEAVHTLNERYRPVVWLKYVHDYKPSEIARQTDLTERQVQRYIEKAAKSMGPALRAIANGRWCEEQEAALLAYIRGEAQDGDALYAQAKRHLDNCAACRRRVQTQRGLAGVLPAPLLLSAASAAGSNHDGLFAVLRAPYTAARDAILGLVTRTPIATNPELVGGGASTISTVTKTALAVCATGAVCVPVAVIATDPSVVPGVGKPKKEHVAKKPAKPVRTANAATTQAATMNTSGLFTPANSPTTSTTAAATTTKATASQSTTKPQGEFSLFSSFEQQAQEFSRHNGANFEKAAARNSFENSGGSSSKSSGGTTAKTDGGSTKKKTSSGGGSADQEFGSGSFETAPAPTTSASTGSSSSTSSTATAASSKLTAPAPAAPSAPAEFGNGQTSSGSFESGGGSRGGGGFEGG
jgi:RNA polymerase sigma factor (sigma-70 family)